MTPMYFPIVLFCVQNYKLIRVVIVLERGLLIGDLSIRKINDCWEKALRHSRVYFPSKCKCF